MEIEGLVKKCEIVGILVSFCGEGRRKEGNGGKISRFRSARGGVKCSFAKF